MKRCSFTRPYRIAVLQHILTLLRVLQINLAKLSKGKQRVVLLCNMRNSLFLANRNYLAAFKKVIALPVDFVSTAATTIASPFQKSSTSSSLNKAADKRASMNSMDTVATSQSTPPSTPKVSTSINRSSSASTILSEQSPTTYTKELEYAKHELDMLQDQLSLEIALQLIHINKESERRVQQFIDIGFPGRMKTDM